MKTCLECGNSDMRVRIVDGATVHECQLCSARFGDRRAVEALADADEAAALGHDPSIWPLVRTLGRLPGLRLGVAAAGDLALRTLPFVELRPASPSALVQLENLAKSLQLCGGVLRCRWIIEVGYRHQLAFVLKPQHRGGPVSDVELQDAGHDVDLLWRQIDRNQRLRWWRHVEDSPGG